jgi:NAD(P)-dependent dehydrogenase (short-subunit alcohol dehydrogenase family)
VSTRAAFVQGATRGLGLELARQALGRGYAPVFATGRKAGSSPGLAGLRETHGEALVALDLDVRDERAIEAAAERVRERTPRLHLVLNCAGVLHEPEGAAPEKKLEHLRPETLRHAFEVNAFGPLLVARHLLDLLGHDERSVLANVSARVGSIEDNRLGGWYAYRGSKAAQNMFTRTLAIELERRAPGCIVVALHPGTVDTELSRPFQGNVDPEKLFPPERAARQLLAIVESLQPEDSGSFLAWDRKPIPW